MTRTVHTLPPLPTNLLPPLPSHRRRELAIPFLLLALIASPINPYTLLALSPTPQPPDFSRLNPSPPHPDALALTTLATLSALALLEAARPLHAPLWPLRHPLLWVLPAALLFGPASAAALWGAVHYIFGPEIFGAARSDARVASPPSSGPGEDEKSGDAREEVVRRREMIVGDKVPLVAPLLLLWVGIPWVLGGAGGGYWVVGAGVVEWVRRLYEKEMGQLRPEAEGKVDREWDSVVVKATVWGLVGIGSIAWIAWVFDAVMKAAEGRDGRDCSDLIIVLVAGMYWNVLLLLDLQKTGRLEGYKWMMLAGSAALFLVVSGPGGTVALSWLFREDFVVEEDLKSATLEADSTEETKQERS